MCCTHAHTNRHTATQKRQSSNLPHHHQHRHRQHVHAFNQCQYARNVIYTGYDGTTHIVLAAFMCASDGELFALHCRSARKRTLQGPPHATTYGCLFRLVPASRPLAVSTMCAGGGGREKDVHRSPGPNFADYAPCHCLCVCVCTVVQIALICCPSPSRNVFRGANIN